MPHTDKTDTQNKRKQTHTTHRQDIKQTRQTHTHHIRKRQTHTPRTDTTAQTDEQTDRQTDPYINVWGSGVYEGVLQNDAGGGERRGADRGVVVVVVVLVEARGQVLVRGALLLRQKLGLFLLQTKQFVTTSTMFTSPQNEVKRLGVQKG